MKMEAFTDRIWLSSPTMHGEEMKYVLQAYESNWMSTIGENIDQVEKISCEKTGNKYAVALSCGTAALHLAIRLSGVKKGDRVFCSDLTFGATVNPVVYEGAEPIFIDSEYDTWNMDPQALEEAFKLYPDVKVVVIVNLYGTPGKMDELVSVCKKHNAIIVEDAAESLGATYKGKQSGAFGDYNIISFNGNKIITGSSGGVFLTDDFEVAKKARKLSTQSREDAPWYQHKELGYNYRMSNVIAGVVRGQYDYLNNHIAKKKAIYMRYKEGFKNLPVTMNPYDEVNMEPNFWLSCMLINKEAMCQQTRSDTTAYFKKEKGMSCPTEILETLAKYNVEGRPIWKPMHMQPIYSKNILVKLKENSVGSDLFDRGLCLPSDIKMTIGEQEKIIEIIRNCFE